MNPESTTPEDDLEIRIVALLLGELPAAEAAELRAKIDADPALQALRARLAATLGLVREAAQQPAEQSGIPAEPLNLSAARREALLARLKTVPLPAAPSRGEWKRYAPLGLAAALVGLIGLAVLRFGKTGPGSIGSLAFDDRVLADPGSEGPGFSRQQKPVSEAKAFGFGIVTNSVLAGEIQPLEPPASAPSPANQPPGQLAGEGGSRARVKTTASPSKQLGFTAEANKKSLEAGRKLAEFGRVAGEAAVPALDYEATGVAVRPGTAPQRHGEDAGRNLGFSDVLADRRPPEPAAKEDALSQTFAITGPVVAESGTSAGESRYFRNVRETDSLAVATPPPASGKPWTVSASPRDYSYSVATANPKDIGLLDSKNSTANESPKAAPATPVLGDQPVLGTLFKETHPTGAASLPKEPALVRSREGGGFGGGFGEGGGAPIDSGVTIPGQPLEALGLAGKPPEASPPIIVLESKSADPTGADERGKGFDWYLGRFNTVAAQGGTAPASSLDGAVAANGRSDLVELATDESRFGAKARLDDSVRFNVPAGRVGALPEPAAALPVQSANGLAADALACGPEAQKREKSQVDSSGAIAGWEQIPQELFDRASKRDDVNEATRQIAELKVRIEQEKAALQLPVAGPVTIQDKASPDAAKNRGFLTKLGEAIRGEKDAAVRISLDREIPEGKRAAGKSNRSIMAGLSIEAVPPAYDPYFVQTEFEKITSTPVLGSVVDGLGLEDAFAKEQGLGRRLSRDEALKLLKDRVSVETDKKSGLVEIHAKAADPELAAQIANSVAEAFKDSGARQTRKNQAENLGLLEKQLAEREVELARSQETLKGLPAIQQKAAEDTAPAKPKAPAPVPQPEVLAAENAFSTFSLNVSDVSFKLAVASLDQGKMPEPASIRSEEFINAFDYRDPAPASGSPLAFAWDRARSPFEHNRDVLRLSIQTAAAGRSAAQPLNLVVLLDSSGSMERADRVGILREALHVLAGQLRPQDRLSVVTFARTAHLRADGVSGDQAAAVFGQVEGVTPEGGTNLEEAMGLAYATARRHFLANGVNRVVVLTDGAANLGNADPEALKRVVEANRRQGVALDCFGVGWEGFNDDLLETLSRNGDGRYGFLNSPEEAANGFAQQLAGALRVAASDVKVQVEFNPKRVTVYRQIGYAKHRLTKEQFRDNTVDAAEIGAAEAGNALYTMEVNPQGEGPLATVRVRYRVPGTQDYREHAWEVPFNGAAPALEYAPPAMRLATTAAEFAEWLSDNPFAAEVSPTALRRALVGVPEFFGANSRAKQLEEAVATAGRLTGK